MQRAKHRAAGRASAEVLATTLLERFADVPASRRESGAPRHGVTTLPARDVEPAGGPALFGPAPHTAPMLVVPTDDDAAAHGDSPLFGAARHARRCRDAAVPAAGMPTPRVSARHVPAPHVPAPHVPAPHVPALPFGVPAVPSVRVRAQPVGAALSVTVLGAAAAVTAVMAPPPSAVETTGSMAPVQNAAPAPALPIAPAATVPAPLALTDQPTVQIGALVSGVAAEMRKADVPYTTVAHAEQLTSPAALRRAAVTNALAKLGKPYRYGALGPNAFDCSGLVKWSFANAGRSLPRTSRAMAAEGVTVRKADLQPGDLVFFYQPISHVGIYIGNGKIIHASRTGQPVKISDMARMRFTTAKRV